MLNFYDDPVVSIFVVVLKMNLCAEDSQIWNIIEKGSYG